MTELAAEDPCRSEETAKAITWRGCLGGRDVLCERTSTSKAISAVFEDYVRRVRESARARKPHGRLSLVAELAAKGENET